MSTTQQHDQPAAGPQTSAAPLLSTCTQVAAGAVLVTGRERTPALAAPWAGVG